MLRTCACSSKMDGYCSLNFLTALITKWCFTSPASQMVVVIVFFETLLMTSWAHLCANRSLWVGLAVPFDHCVSNRRFPSCGSEFHMIFASWKVVITMNFLTWKMILIMWIIQINCVFDNSATHSHYTASSLYFWRVTKKREKFAHTQDLEVPQREESAKSVIVVAFLASPRVSTSESRSGVRILAVQNLTFMHSTAD